MLEFLSRPLRSALGAAEHEAARPIKGAEHEISQASAAAHRVAESIEQHLKALDSLAQSVGPLTESVNRLNDTMTQLVTLLAPVGAAGHEVEHVERLFGFRRHHKRAPAPPPAASTTPAEGAPASPAAPPDAPND